MAGLMILKYTHDLSDEALCERWVENPYYQYFCGEEFFQHGLVFDRSLADALAPAHGRGEDASAAAGEPGGRHQDRGDKPSRLCSRHRRHDGAAQGVMFPTDAKLMNRARDSWCGWRSGTGCELRQSYARVGKLALIKHQRYAHAQQFKRANKALRKLRTYLGRVIRDISRRIEGNDVLRRFFGKLEPGSAGARPGPAPARPEGLFAACPGSGVHRQGQSAPALRVRRQGQRRDHPQAQAAASSSPMWRRCPAILMTATRWHRHSGHGALIGDTIERALADAGYRGHNAPPGHRFKIFTAGQKRRVTPQIKREFNAGPP